MIESLADVLNGIGAVRGLLLVAAGASAWRAVYLMRLDDRRDPVPWAFVLIACLALLTLLSL